MFYVFDILSYHSQIDYFNANVEMMAGALITHPMLILPFGVNMSILKDNISTGNFCVCVCEREREREREKLYRNKRLKYIYETFY